MNLHFGVPQESVIDPNNCYMYTKPVGEIAKSHKINCRCYADDTQVYRTLKSDNNWNGTSSSVQACVADQVNWLNSNMLGVLCCMLD